MTMCSRDMVYQIHSKGKRISITLRKQPDPDWKPDESELVGKKSKPIELGKNIHSNNEADRPKKKAISGISLKNGCLKGAGALPWPSLFMLSLIHI